MWNEDTYGDFSFVVPTSDGGFKFFPFNIENADAYMEEYRKQNNFCGAV